MKNKAKITSHSTNENWLKELFDFDTFIMTAMDLFYLALFLVLIDFFKIPFLPAFIILFFSLMGSNSYKVYKDSLWHKDTLK